MNWTGVAGLILAALLVFSAGCTTNAAKNQTQGTVSDTPTLPEEYNARAAGTPVITLVKPTVTVNATPPTLSAYQLTTIATSNLSASGINMSATSSDSSATGITAPVASFTSTTPAGFIPFAVQFTDTSQNQPTSWSWDFGDGGTSDLQNPVHTYTAGGRFNINLSATNAAGTGTMSAANFISVYAPGFYGTPVSGNHPLTVIFTDTGYGYPAPSSWFWDFGDGMTSSLANTSHQYTSAGLFNVSHRVTTTSGTIWVNRTGYILVA